ncbi:MAG TPA: nucleotidyltransferase family protein [Actinomycetales bacterium]|nr:nucleotidyltransferase family protein [Actinomycetales bacterium]
MAGLLLAAGEGRRYGRPKALVRDEAGVPWLASAANVLLEGGCRPVVVVLGASAAEAETLLPEQPDAVTHVRADGWEEGMGASLRVGLAAAAELRPHPVAVLIGLVDTPGVTREVVARVMELASPDVLAQAAYDGRPGHPVLIGRNHWSGVRDVAVGDRGARDYLREREVVRVECGDIGDGRDVDLPT